MADTEELENFTAAALLLLIGISCIGVHCIILRAAVVQKQYKVSFFALCCSRSVAHVTASFAIMISTVPAMLMKTDFFSLWINYIILTVASLNISEFLLALNRFVAVFWWQKYEKFWKNFTTWLLNIATWVLGAIVLWYGLMLGCYLKFDKETFLAPNSKDFCYDIVVGQYILNSSMFLAICLNVTTLGKMLFSLRRSRWMQDDSSYRIRKNIGLFLFSFTQCCLWLALSIIWTLQVPALINHRLYVLLTTFGLQLLVHFAEGCAFIAFNKREVFAKSSNSISVHRNSMPRPR